MCRMSRKPSADDPHQCRANDWEFLGDTLASIARGAPVFGDALRVISPQPELAQQPQPARL